MDSIIAERIFREKNIILRLLESKHESAYHNNANLQNCFDQVFILQKESEQKAQ
jgi:hypothetical protein